MKFEIRKAKNGWIIKSEDPEEFTPEIVAQEEPDEHEGFRTLLWEFLNHYGPSDGKYSKKRIRIVILPGNSYEGPLDEEYRKSLEDLRDELNNHLESSAPSKISPTVCAEIKRASPEEISFSKKFGFVDADANNDEATDVSRRYIYFALLKNVL